MISKRRKKSLTKNRYYIEERIEKQKKKKNAINSKSINNKEVNEGRRARKNATIFNQINTTKNTANEKIE